MNPAIWICLIVIMTISTLECGYKSMSSIQDVTTYKSKNARLPAVLWTAGAGLSLLGLLIVIFSA